MRLCSFFMCHFLIVFKQYRIQSFMYSVLFSTFSRAFKTSTSALKAINFRSDLGRPAPVLHPPLFFLLLFSSIFSDFIDKFSGFFKS